MGPLLPWLPGAGESSPPTPVPLPAPGVLKGPAGAEAFSSAKQRGESRPALLSGLGCVFRGSDVLFRPGRGTRGPDPGRARPGLGGGAEAGQQALARAGQL